MNSSGAVLVSMRLEDSAGICDGVRELAANGFRVLATPGTAEALRDSASIRRAAVGAIRALQLESIGVRALQGIHAA